MKVIRLLVLVLLVSAVAFAQDHPKAEIFGGYSYLRLRSGIDQNLNGWNAALTGNFNRFLGITADFAGNYGSETVDTTIGGVTTRVGADIKNYTFLFGPQIGYRAGKVRPFGHALFGAGHVSLDPTATVGGISIPSSVFGGLSLSDTAWAMALGGGLDFALSPRFSIRPVQADWLRTNYFSTTQNNFRYSAGIVLNLGSK